jgi:phage I-like protein
MSIASEISRILSAKESLKTTINNKGGNITTERIDQFASEVAALPSPKDEEEKILTPDFSSGNHVIVPTTDKVLRQVTLTKPVDLLPKNIAKDKNVCGVVGTSFTAIELTQTQYDALSTKDSNTYYLIVEG